MAALPEIEHISYLLSRATSKTAAEVIKEETVTIARIEEGIDLVYGLFHYQTRGVGVPGRALTFKTTMQPVLAVRERGRIVPLPYAEDVTRHPLRDKLEDVLIALSLG